MSVRPRPGEATCRTSHPDAHPLPRFSAYLLTIPAFLATKPDLATTSSLQKLVDCVREHPSWSLAHLAVALDMTDLLASPTFKSTVDLVDSEGQTAVMLAVVQGSKHLTTAVLAAGCSLHGGDRAGPSLG